MCRGSVSSPAGGQRRGHAERSPPGLEWQPMHEYLPLPRKKLETAGNAGLAAEPRGLGSLRVTGAWRTANYHSRGPSSPGGCGSQEAADCSDGSLLLPFINLDFSVRHHSFRWIFAASGLQRCFVTPMAGEGSCLPF